MARIKNPKRDEAFEIYKSVNGGITLAEIARMINVTTSTVQGWKFRDDWDSTLGIKKKPQKHLIGNKYATSCGPKMKGNKNAQIHGLYSRYFPDETREIVDALQDSEPIDLLWNQILIAAAAVIRSQKLLFVENKYDDTIIRSHGDSIAYIETATTKQQNYLSALARVQGQLNMMLQRYDKMLNEDPLATEEQKLRIEHLKATIELTRTKTDTMRGISEVEDLEAVDEEIFGPES